MINTIIFDYGGVISKSRSKCIKKKVAESFGVSAEEFSKVFKKYNPDYEKGLMINVKYLNLVIREVGMPCSMRDLAEIIYSCDLMEHRLVHLIKRLIKKKLSLVLLSNSNPILTEKIRHNKLFKDFDGYFFSDYIGTRKPDIKIFKTCLSTMKKQPYECVFIDDREGNILAAKRLGINTIHFSSHHDLKHQLKRLGLL